MSTVATVSWTANTEIDLAGYNLYYGLDPNNYATLSLVTNTYAVDSSLLTSDGLYYFTVSAFDTASPVNTSLKATPVTKRVIRTANKIIVRR